MDYDVSSIDPHYSFSIQGVSYVGNPQSHTAMYITQKISPVLSQLTTVVGCLVFAEEGMSIPDELRAVHCFVMSKNPQAAYAEFVVDFAKRKDETEKALHLTQMPGGWWCGEGVVIGQGCYIEPQAIISHGVHIGNDAVILAGAVIRNTIAGDKFYVNEYAVVGANAFTMATNLQGEKIRIPALGGVQIGDNVEIGAHDNISRGTAGDTILEDGVKLDALVHVGHDARLEAGAELAAGAIIGGFSFVGKDTFFGVNSSVRNRKSVGAHTTIGMGAAVVKNIENNCIAAGVPARRTGWVCECGKVLKPSGGGALRCPECGRTYTEAPEGLVSTDEPASSQGSTPKSSTHEGVAQ